jgi:hypothetical protein
MEQEQIVKTGFHLAMAALAVVEFKISNTNMRRMLCGGCAGWHIAAAIIDALDMEDGSAT